MDKLRLHGFNNLTKSLSFNIYDICYANTATHKKEYIEYIDECYNAGRLTEILREVTEIIGANILNISYQDYEPQGASVTMLIAEEPVDIGLFKNIPGVHPETVVGHLDKVTLRCIPIQKATLKMVSVLLEQISTFLRVV